MTEISGNDSKKLLETVTKADEVPGETIVTVERGQIYVTKQTESTPLRIRMGTLYFQAIFSLIVAAISCWVIASTPAESNQKAVPWAMLSSTLAYWLPNPSQHKG